MATGTRRESLTKFAWLSIGAAIATIALKSLAAAMTGSVGLLSDAMESGVNLVAAVVALAALKAAEKGADDEFSYGREKAEYLSAGVEGAMIFVAAISIAYTAINRLIHPGSLDKMSIGLGISLAASLINIGVAQVLLRAGREHRSITLEADGRHLMTDVWTSIGVVVAMGAVALTGWDWLDPVIALAVAVNIVVAGVGLIRRSVRGLLDVSLPPDELAIVDEVLKSHRSSGLDFHAVRTRQAGRRAFMTFHLLVPGSRSVREAHDEAEEIEAELRERLPHLSVMIHIEPLEDPRSYADLSLDPVSLPPSAHGPFGPQV